jgi:uncharacterized protein (DUF362 family)
MSTTTVSIVRDLDLKAKAEKAIELLGGIGKVVGSGDKVLIKPNLVDGASPETGETVHPEFTMAIVDLVKGAGAKRIMIGEAPTWQDLSLHNLYTRLAKEAGAEMINFNEEPFDEVHLKDPFYFKTVRIARAALQCDVFINVPTLKTHHLAGVTVAMKNLYGLIPREDKRLYHRIDRLEEAIVDLNIARPSDLILVDGTFSTHHIPPFEKQRLDLAIGGCDPVAVDTVAAKVIGVDPRTLRFLAWAEEKGLGTRDLGRISIAGLSIGEAYRKDTVTILDLCKRKYRNIRIIDGQSCTGCFGRIGTALYGAFKEDVFKEELYILMGPKAVPPKKDARIILCGNCLAPTFYNGLRGTFVPGCPPDLQEFRKILESLASSETKKP